DVTERKLNEARIARLTNVQALMGSINAAIVRTDDRETLLAESCRIAVEVGGLAHAAVIEVNQDSGLTRVLASAPPDSPVLREIAADLGTGTPMNALLSTVLEQKLPVVSND